MELDKIRNIGRLVYLYMQGELSKHEETELEEWRSALPEHEQLFRQLTTQEDWDENIRSFVKNEGASEAEWIIIRRRTVVRMKAIKWRWIYRYAALLVLMLGGASVCWWYSTSFKQQNFLPAFQQINSRSTTATLLFSDGRKINLEDMNAVNYEKELRFEVDTHKNVLKYQKSENPRIDYHTLCIPRGGEFVVVLGDNTKVYLNSESELRYPTSFSGKERRVILKGEAYFEVAANKECPFIVEVNGMQVKVLGTSFGVRAYENESRVTTTLVTGNVNISASQEVINLRPNQQVVFDRKEGRMKVHTVDVRLYLGWKDGRLIFDNVPLIDILNDLSRWYNFQVLYADEKLKSIPFSLDIAKHNKIEEVLALLEHTGKLSFAIEKNVVMVK